MLGIYPKNSLADSVDILRSFRKLSVCGAVKDPRNPGHPDGWGILSWVNGMPGYFGREPTDASKDPKFEEGCRTIESTKISSPLIAHLRKASVGAKTKENTHPFVNGKWAFAHNGTIRGLNLRVATDSQWFFEKLLERSSVSDGDMIIALAQQVKHVRKVYRYSSMTFMLSDGSELYAYRDYSKEDAYYTMFYTRTKEGLIFCQEKIFESDWQEVQNGELVVVNTSMVPKSYDIQQEIVRSKELLTTA